MYSRKLSRVQKHFPKSDVSKEWEGLKLYISTSDFCDHFRPSPPPPAAEPSWSVPYIDANNNSAVAASPPYVPLGFYLFLAAIPPSSPLDFLLSSC